MVTLREREKREMNRREKSLTIFSKKRKRKELITSSHTSQGYYANEEHPYNIYMHLISLTIMREKERVCVC